MSTTSASSSDRAAAFERLFQAAEKQSRGFVPFPEHLRSLENRSTFSSTLAQTQAQNHQNEKQQQNQNQTQHQTSSFEKKRLETEKAAYDFCASHVPNLADNIDRANESLDAAQDAQSDVESMLNRVDKMTEVTKTVREYSERMSSNASALIAKRAKAEGVLNGLSERLKKFQKVDSLHDEAIAATKYIATTSRFVAMLDEIEEAAAFLADVPHFKQSAQVYSTRLSIAYQRSMSALRDHCCDSLRDAAKNVTESELMKKVLIVKKNSNTNNTPNLPPPPTSSSKPPANLEEENQDQQDGENKKEPSTTNNNLPSRPEKLSDALNLIDAEFTSALESSETAFRLIEARIGAKEAEQFVIDVFSSYTDARLQIVEPLLVEYSSSSSPKTTSGGGAFNATNFVHNIVETCVAEANLFQKMWISDLSSSHLRGPLEALVSAGYEIFRSKLLALDAVGQLCSLSFTLNDIQKKLHSAAKQQHNNSGNKNTNYSNEENNNNNNNKHLVSSVSLRNELIANAVSRFIQDTDERLMFRVSIYLRNGLCAPANIYSKVAAATLPPPPPTATTSTGTTSTPPPPPPPSSSTTSTKTIPISEWIFEKATEAIFKKQFDPTNTLTNNDQNSFGSPQSIDIPTPYSTPFCLGSVIRLRWLCAQLKRSASGAAAFAPFLEEATKAVINDVMGVLRSSWTSSSFNSSSIKSGIGAKLFSSSESTKQIEEKQKESFFSAISNLLPYALALRQLLFTREALLSVGARLATVESSFTFSLSMQISKVEMEVPRVVEAPFREVSDEAIKKLCVGIFEQQKEANQKESEVSLQSFASTLQVCFDQSVATQHLVWRAAVPLAVDKVFANSSKEDGGVEEKKEELKNKWNAML